MIRQRTKEQIERAVQALTSQAPSYTRNVFNRCRAEVEIPADDGSGEYSFAGLGATNESALLDLLRDVSIHFRNEIEHAHGCTTADDEETDDEE